jgi:hypothetical protein
MALPCRWRSRPQHHKLTYAAQQTTCTLPSMTPHKMSPIANVATNIVVSDRFCKKSSNHMGMYPIKKTRSSFMLHEARAHISPRLKRYNLMVGSLRGVCPRAATGHAAATPSKRAVILVNSSQEEQKRVWLIERASLQESQCRSRKPLPNPTVLPTRREVPESPQVPQRFTVDNLTVSNQSCAQSRLPFWPGVWATAS